MQNFQILVPEVSNNFKYSITGADSQVITLGVNPGDRIEASPGSMLMLSSDISTNVECGKCTRVCTGETLCKVIFTNKGASEGFVALTPDFPAKVVPVELSRVGTLITKQGAYMGSQGEVSVTADCDCNIATCCCGGLGFIRQKASGNGLLILAASGTVVQKNLAAGEKIIIDTTSLVGYQESAKLGIQKAGGCCTMCCGGEGLFNTTVEGPGLVIIQSMSFEKYKAAVAPLPRANNGAQKTT